jgi:hypothetical protein
MKRAYLLYLVLGMVIALGTLAAMPATITWTVVDNVPGSLTAAKVTDLKNGVNTLSANAFDKTGDAMSGDLDLDGNSLTNGNDIQCDTVSETTAAGGVTVDGVLLKDGGATLTAAAVLGAGAQTDTISEKTAATGVTIDGALIKDGRYLGSPKAVAKGHSVGGFQSVGTQTQIVLGAGSEYFDTDGAMSNFAFTAPRDGYYRVTLNVEYIFCMTGSSTTTLEFAVYIDGTADQYEKWVLTDLPDAPAPGTGGFSFSTVVAASATEVLTFGAIVSDNTATFGKTSISFEEL